ncbi:MAG: Formate hydrogenlyase transcriptional activator [Candidatus Rifleibacterium amylolyticum]|nr:MAG: Formate hydrogenlyase transcriptional activator [Candidatus Rifleibacterium amylolyticum]
MTPHDMTLDDMSFFHQATKKICGSLDLQTVLENCLIFFQKYMPLDGIIVNIYDPRSRSVIHVAAAGATIFKPLAATIPLSDEASRHIEEESGGTVEIIDQPGKHIVTRKFWEVIGKKDVSALLLKLEIENEKLGVVTFIARGSFQYSNEHARLVQLLHDPFAIALSNTLKYQEVLRLKELLANDNRYLSQQLHKIAGDEIVGSEFGLKSVMEQVRQIAPQQCHVLLLGETGTGKEVIANAIHYSSPRSEKPFIKVNCGAIPDTLIDSELFGHEKGAFTGAFALKRGLFERAHTGTLFLDEIGELPLQAQVRLLRVLQNKEFERVGGSQVISVDIRLIAATHRDLPAMVREGKFREDLWFRLNVFPITIPPLRQRKSDIPALTWHFIEKKSREMNIGRQLILAPDALKRLQDYDWPGNVRELENIVERTVIVNMTISPDRPLFFEPEMQISDHEHAERHAMSAKDSMLLNLDDVTKNHILMVLEMTNGKVQGKNGAAELLGIHPNTLRNRMKKLGISYGRNNHQSR